MAVGRHLQDLARDAGADSLFHAASRRQLYLCSNRRCEAFAVALQSLVPECTLCRSEDREVEGGRARRRHPEQSELVLCSTTADVIFLIAELADLNPI